MSDCGVVAAISPKDDVVGELYIGLRSLQHRGQDSAGMAIYDGTNTKLYRDKGLVNEVFSKRTLELLEGANVGIGHVRYSTTGSSGIPSQPEVKDYSTPNGRRIRTAMASNGDILDQQELRKRLPGDYSTGCDIEDQLMALNAGLKHFDKITPENIFEAYKNLYTNIEGAWFSAAIIPDGNGRAYLCLSNDSHSVRPGVLGKKGKRWLAASETTTLNKLDYEFVRNMQPGEVDVIDEDGNVHTTAINPSHPAHCMFEYLYLAYPPSRHWGVSVLSARYEFGKKLGKLYPRKVDAVVPIPDSGNEIAQGYSAQTGIRLVHGLIRSKFVGRVFMLPEQADRDVEALLKFDAVPDLLEGKDVALIDDTVVRGTNIRKVIKIVKNAEAKDIDVLTAGNPRKPCYLGIEMKDKRKFAAWGGNGESKPFGEIARDIGARFYAALKPQEQVEALNEAIKDPNLKMTLKDFCTGCLGGLYPSTLERRIEEIIKES